MTAPGRGIASLPRSHTSVAPAGAKVLQPALEVRDQGAFSKTRSHFPDLDFSRTNFVQSVNTLGSGQRTNLGVEMEKVSCISDGLPDRIHYVPPERSH